MIKRLFILAFGIFLWGLSCHAQEIDFSQYGNYNISSTVVNGNGLKFGQVISSDSPQTYSTNIGNASIVSFTAIRYLDVIVDISLAPTSCDYPMSDLNFDLKVAYDNSGGDHAQVGKAKFVTNVTSNNSVIFRIPVLERQQLPPGPPPSPPTNSFDQSKIESTFYLFFYGNITVGNVPAGSYCNDIDITVNYD